MRYSVAVLLVLSAFGAAIPVHAKDSMSPLAKLVSIHEQPLMQIMYIDGTIAAKTVEFTGDGDYLKQAITPKVLLGFIPLMKSGPVIVVKVNIDPSGQRPSEFFFFINPADIIAVTRSDSLSVPTAHVEYKDAKEPEKGIAVSLKMSMHEHGKSPAILPAFTK
jgi:hypothetical protein